MLGHCPVSHILSTVPTLQLITCTLHDSVDTVLKQCDKARILSIPVVDERGTIVGRVSVLDIIRYIAWSQTNMKEKTPEKKAMELSRYLNKQMRKVLINATLVAPKDRAWSGGEPFKLPLPWANVFTIDALIAPFSHGIHRILFETGRPQFGLWSNESDFYINLSQTDVIRYLSEHQYLVKDSVMKATLSHCECYSHKIVTVGSGTKTLDAFQKMWESQVYAVGIMDEEDNSFIGTLSISDLRSLGIQNCEETYKMLTEKSVVDFLRHGDKKLRKPVCVTPKDTLAEALRRIVAQRIHMLWVVSSDFKPVGSLHTSDIFKLFGKGTLNPAV